MRPCEPDTSFFVVAVVNTFEFNTSLLIEVQQLLHLLCVSGLKCQVNSAVGHEKAVTGLT